MITLSETQPGTILLSGTLTMDNAAEAKLQLAGALANGAMMLDLSGIERCDSAALALLLALRRRKDTQNILLANMPPTLLGLAKLYELSPLLGFSQESES